MSVYKRKNASTYSYDFWLRGRRFSGDTRCATKREAEAAEKRIREAAQAELAGQQAFFASEMTFQVAASRWWLEVGQHHTNSDNTLAVLDWLKTEIGAETDLRQINDSRVASIVAKRRGQRRHGRKDAPLVSNATVNRTVTQPLREIILRARKVWKVAVADVDFAQHLLPEPKERVREASQGEESAIMATLGRGYDIAVRFAFLTACRRMEILGLEWAHVDFFSCRFTVTGKGGKIRTIPMSQEIYDLLWDQKDFHPVKVFTFEALRTRKDAGLVRGERYPLTESGLKSAFRRAVPKSGVANFRFHDTRHTSATRVLRASNLRVAQKLLGHSDIATTTKYAHALDDDIREALEKSNASSPTKNPTAGHYTDDMMLKNMEKKS